MNICYVYTIYELSKNRKAEFKEDKLIFYGIRVQLRSTYMDKKGNEAPSILDK
jgi:hypothetical protein